MYYYVICIQFHSDIMEMQFRADAIDSTVVLVHLLPRSRCERKLCPLQLLCITARRTPLIAYRYTVIASKNQFTIYIYPPLCFTYNLKGYCGFVHPKLEWDQIMGVWDMKQLVYPAPPPPS